MNSYVYILLCRDGSYYTGSTNNIERRLSEHQSGCGANYTSKRLPVELVYYEEFLRIDDAFYREKQVQGWNRKKKEALINNKPKELPLLSKNYTQFPRESHLDTSAGGYSHSGTSTSSVSSEPVVKQFDKLSVSPVKGTSTNVKTTRSYSHFDTSTSSVSSELNDRVLVVEHFDKLSVSPVETTRSYVHSDTSTSSVSSKLNDQRIENLEK